MHEFQNNLAQLFVWNIGSGKLKVKFTLEGQTIKWSLASTYFVIHHQSHLVETVLIRDHHMFSLRNKKARLSLNYPQYLLLSGALLRQYLSLHRAVV